MDKATYLKQHKEIEEKINSIERLIKENNPEKNAEVIASSISTLAGILSIHLGIEDKFMYTKLSVSEDESVRKMVARYKEQMGGIAAEFTNYKKKYNTKQLILNNRNTLKSETDKMFLELKQRIKREEEELYLHI